ncbi:UNVERIFIED_ORG: fucose permease [Arthrobacter sp. UYEF10]
MNPNPKSLLLALVLPFVLMITGVAVLGPSDARIFGVPAIFLFMFVMFPTVSALMAVAWRRWDRHEIFDDETPDVEESAK